MKKNVLKTRFIDIFGFGLLLKEEETGKTLSSSFHLELLSEFCSIEEELKRLYGVEGDGNISLRQGRDTQVAWYYFWVKICRELLECYVDYRRFEAELLEIN